ncbi:Pentapeptide repeat-containing protein [Thermomonospora echinospora]|uniref:Pentapeptide repeat-containing protein n=1 Tax=Thermomonospora echinospora TaxID=1992 RepID=A0A1H6D0G5_9ACTN|nr:pentapeptide repeat-containing protein [Thermomonospora echinospora]SEG78762.1 Pentapeptide repeat-containing protein [Thermomonospora echinospora]
MTTGTDVELCEEPRTDDPSQACAASCLPGIDRCLAHAGEQAREEFLAGLVPGAAIDMGGVPFTADLLARLLDAVRDPRADNRPSLGRASFVGASFSGNADFGGASFSRDAHFGRASFSRYADFGGTSFLGDADFVGASFSGDTRFSGASFSGNAHFGRTSFSGYADFGEASFSGNARFRWASFSGKADFGWTSFSGYADFIRASFSGDVYFVRALFSEDAYFNEAKFASEAGWFSCRIGILSLDDVVAEGEVRVEATAGQVSAWRLRSAGRVALRLRTARVDLSELVCSGPVSVHALARPIPGVPDLDGPTRVAVTSLRGVDAGSLTLTDVDLRQCLFAGLHRADQIQLDGHCTFAPGPGGRRRVLAEEHHWHAARRTARRGAPGPWRPAPDGVEVVGPRRIEVIYRQLRKALEEGKNEPGAADFYYGEMQMRRAAARRGERLLLWLYWVTSGYGLRAGRALTALIVAVAALALAMQHAGFPGAPPSYLDALLYAFRSAFAVDIKTPTVPETVTRWGQVIRIALRIAGPLFIGLAALAIRNQVKR